MAFKLPSTTNVAGAPAPAAAQRAPAQSQAQRDEEYVRQQDEKRRPAPPDAPVQQQASRPVITPPSRRAAYHDEGVGEQPVDDGQGARLPYASTFSDHPAGTYTSLCAVEAITHWEPGRPSVHLRVRVGPEAGREYKWDQSMPPPAAKDPAGGFATFWKRTLFGAYAAGGWTAEADPETGWEGWPRSQAGDYIPPYAEFFVVEIEGQSIPVLLEVKVQVDKGYESRPKIISVKRHIVDGSLVQAPMPRKLTPWIAEHHRWSGVRKDIEVKAKDDRAARRVESVEVKWDQFPRGFGGLLGLKDCT